MTRSRKKTFFKMVQIYLWGIGLTLLLYGLGAVFENVGLLLLSLPFSYVVGTMSTLITLYAVYWYWKEGRKRR
jgi:hypothetical protein